MHLSSMGSSGFAVPHVVAIGASAGGMSALTTLLAALPPGLPAPILIVQHLSPRHISHLAQLLRRTGYSVTPGADSQTIETGHAYVAPPDRHMIVDRDGRIRLQDTARVQFTRPSVDVLFSSLASVYGSRVIAVVLSGGGSDGTEGAHDVQRHGGVVIVQSEASSEHFGMPGSVVAHGYANHVLPLASIADFLVELTTTHHA